MRLTAPRSLVIDHVQQTMRPANEICVFFYFDYRMQEFQTPVAFTASLLRQVLSQLPSIPEYVHSYYEYKRPNNAHHSPEELFELLRKCVASSGACYIVVDALDECRSALDRRKIIGSLLRLDTGKVKLFITSRPHCTELESQFPNCYPISIKANREDIMAYCASVIESNEHTNDLVDDKLKLECLNAVANEASGM